MLFLVQLQRLFPSLYIYIHITKYNIMGWVDSVNDAVAHSPVGKYFQLDGSGARRERKGTKFMTEIRAGLTTFFAMVNDQ